MSEDYEKQLMRLLTRKEKNGLIINNPAQSMFMFIDRQHLEVNSISLRQHLEVNSISLRQHLEVN